MEDGRLSDFAFYFRTVHWVKDGKRPGGIVFRGLALFLAPSLSSFRRLSIFFLLFFYSWPLFYDDIDTEVRERLGGYSVFMVLVFLLTLLLLPCLPATLSLLALLFANFQSVSSSQEFLPTSLLLPFSFSLLLFLFLNLLLLVFL